MPSKANANIPVRLNRQAFPLMSAPPLDDSPDSPKSPRLQYELTVMRLRYRKLFEADDSSLRFESSNQWIDWTIFDKIPADMQVKAHLRALPQNEWLAYQHGFGTGLSTTTELAPVTPKPSMLPMPLVHQARRAGVPTREITALAQTALDLQTTPHHIVSWMQNHQLKFEEVIDLANLRQETGFGFSSLCALYQFCSRSEFLFNVLLEYALEAREKHYWKTPIEALIHRTEQYFNGFPERLYAFLVENDIGLAEIHRGYVEQDIARQFVRFGSQDDLEEWEEDG
ncbi:MAG: hypothetical protein CEN89_628 [Candidatus Berkelbacteria bacterium Licking1014_7]|uniref:Uncharacterized protein n=1 Tax=Candidatus Berkelbacteria bacterium Licking1014_7 TaxID=2017147 RepID=A0A554LI43_9BACT|nr:MAG: hypothetical protein CEN89_628 [Candidatus Berkelbacteria bacterium Licking1014_7]